MFDFDIAVKLVEDNERLVKLLKIAKYYDYIFEVVDDEPLDPLDFGEYEYSRELDFQENFEHSITRLNARRGISIGVTIRVHIGYNGIDFGTITEIGIGLIKNGFSDGYCVVL